MKHCCRLGAVLTALSLVHLNEVSCSANNAVEQNNHGPSLKEVVRNQQAHSARLKRHITPSNCAEVQLAGHRTNGIYTLQMFSKEIEVYCDLTTDGGGWTVIQRRDDHPPPTDFYQNWMSYKLGFGDLNKEFWLGLDNIHRLTSSVPCSLRIEMEDFENGKRFAKYRNFHVASESSNYKLLAGGFSGDAGDSLTGHNGLPFSTWDRDHDSHATLNCAAQFVGAWWYGACHSSNLNGKYLRGNHSTHANGVNWHAWRGHYYSLKKAEMKIRPVDFQSYLVQ